MQSGSDELAGEWVQVSFTVDSGGMGRTRAFARGRVVVSGTGWLVLERAYTDATTIHQVGGGFDETTVAIPMERVNYCKIVGDEWPHDFYGAEALGIPQQWLHEQAKR